MLLPQTSRCTIRLAVFASAIVLSSLAAIAATPADNDLLQQVRIEPTLVGVTAFLRSLDPEDEANQPVRQLIAQLTSDNFAEREAATQKLIDWPVIPEACLADAAVSPDREVRDRVDHIFRRAKGTPQWQVAQAVFRTIHDQPIQGAAVDLLDARQWIEHEPTRAMLAEVLTATAVPGNAELFRQQFAQSDPQTKAMLAGALVVALHSQAPEALRPLLADGEPQIRLVVIRTLLNLGEREALRALGPLLNVEDLTVRCEAIELFQAATGQPIGFVAYKDAAERRAAMSRWSQWLEAQGATVELKLPLLLASQLPGRVTVCLPEANRVLDLDMQGKLVEELQTSESPKGCERQPNGNWLVASYKGRHLAEFDSNGMRIMQMNAAKLHDLKGPMRVTRLANGNFLSPFLDSMTVAEIDPNGAIVWQVQNNLWPMDADRLDNGNTLVTFAESGVVEYDPGGKIVWQIEGLKPQRPNAAQRLPNGNTLISLNKVRRVDEFDPSGKSVWSGEFAKPMDVHRMADGSTIISEESGVKRIDQDGNLLWHYAVVGAAGIRVHSSR